MTISTLRPNATVASSGVSVTGGGGDLDAVLADDSDATYVSDIGSLDSFLVGFANFAQPAGAVIKDCAVRVRLARTSPGTSVLRAFCIFGAGPSPLATGVVTWASPTTVQALRASSVGITVTDSMMDGFELDVFGSSTASDLVRVYAAYLDVIYVVKPDLAIDTPADESVVEDTNLPTISWTPDLDSDGGAQTNVQVKVFNAAQLAAGGFDPSTSEPFVGMSAGSEFGSEPDVVGGELEGNDLDPPTGVSTSWQVARLLPDDTYRAYVRIAQTVNGAAHWSDWATADFDVAVDLPGEPGVDLVAESADGRLRLDIAEGSGDATTDLFEVQASYDGGVIYGTLRTLDGAGLVAPEFGEASVWDHEGGNGEDVTYRVRALHDYSGVYAVSDWVEETGMWGPTRDQWLKHPLTPALNAKVRIHTYPSAERQSRQGRVQPLGRSTLVISSDTRAPWGGSIQVYCRDDAERASLDEILAAPGGLPLLLQVAATDKRPDRWVVLGGQNREHDVDKAYVDSTIDTFDWVEAARP